MVPATLTGSSEAAKNNVSVWIVWRMNFYFCQLRLNFSHRGPEQRFCMCRASFNMKSLNTFTSDTFGSETPETAELLDFSRQSNLYFRKPPAAGCPPGNNRRSLFGENLLDWQRVPLIPRKTNLIDQSSQNSNFGLIRLDFETQFPRKQLSGYLLSRSQTKQLTLYQFFHCPYLFVPTFLKNWSSKNYVYLWCFFGLENFLLSYRLHVFIKT